DGRATTRVAFGWTDPMMAFARRFLQVSLACAPALMTAQAPPTARLVGLVVEETTGSPIGGARVEIVGTTSRATTAVDGRYSISGITAGTHALRVVMVGYAPKRVTGIVLGAGQTAEQDVSLGAT